MWSRGTHIEEVTELWKWNNKAWNREREKKEEEEEKNTI